MAALVSLEVTIGAVGDQPTRVITAVTPIRQVIFEADDGNSNAAFVGDSGMATDGSEGIRLTNSATVPGRALIGPFSGDAPAGLQEFFIVGTENEIVNILYIRA